jgi:hypothetical protein
MKKYERCDGADVVCAGSFEVVQRGGDMMLVIWVARMVQSCEILKWCRRCETF